MRNLILRVFEYFFITFLFLLTLLTISGVSFFESFRFAFVSGIICVSGGQLWKMISKCYDLSTFEFMGMGLAFGSAAASGLQIVLRTTPLSGIAWVLVCVFIPIGLKIESHQDFYNPKALNSRSNNLSLVLTYLDLVAVVAFALAWHWWWIYPFALAATISALTLRLHFRKNTTTTFRAFILGLILLVPIYVLCTTLRVRNDLWRVISHDQVFSESLSWSLNTYGRGDSPFLSGFEINYHWLTLHWAGLLTQASNGGSWISVTQVIPILSYLGMFSLLVTIASKLRNNSSVSTLTAIPFLFLSNTLGFNLERFLVSPTFQFTCVWMLATLIIFINSAKAPSTLKIISMGLMLFATFGGKAMNGLVILGGLAIALLVKITFRGQKNRAILLFSLSIAVLATVCAYFYYFRSTEITNTNTLKFGLQIGSDVGIINPESGIPLQLVASLIFNLSVSLPVVIALICITRVWKEQKTLVNLISAAMIVGILATSITTHEGASQLYFMMASIVISFAVFPLIAIKSKLDQVSYLKIILISGIIGVSSQALWNHSSELTDYRNYIYVKLLAACLIPFGAVIFSLWNSFMKPVRNTIGKSFTSIFCSIILLSSISIGIFQRIEKIPVVSKVIPTNQGDPTLITGSLDHLDVLSWIRQNTKSDEILAINRFCIPGVNSCIMKWQLVSAISHRRILIEGGYGSPTQLQAGEIQERYYFSYQFANSPDFESLRYLCDKGVRWFFYDTFDSPNVEDWSPYARVSISNKSVSLLRLNCV